MDNWTLAMTLVLGANFIMLLFIFLKIGGFGKIEWEWMLVRLLLLFKRKITVKPHIQHYRPNQWAADFFLVKTYKCSEQRFFKIMSGTYTTIVPMSEIYEIKYGETTEKP